MTVTAHETAHDTSNGALAMSLILSPRLIDGDHHGSPSNLRGTAAEADPAARMGALARRGGVATLARAEHRPPTLRPRGLGLTAHAHYWHGAGSLMLLRCHLFGHKTHHRRVLSFAPAGPSTRRYTKRSLMCVRCGAIIR